MGSWLDQRAKFATPVSGSVNVDAVLAVPLTGAGQVNGVLTAARAVGRPSFTAEDLEMAAGFANQASVSIELADARTEQQRNQLLDERDRIAAELHIKVVQRLYALGLSLQTALGAARSPIVINRLRAAIVELDDVIGDVQQTVVQLDNVLARPGWTVHDRVLEVTSDVGAALGFAVSTRFSGKVDAVEPVELADELVHALRTGLRLIATHAGPTSVRVEVRSDSERLSLVIAHDGPSVFDSAVSAELAAAMARAERQRGSSEVTPTELRWTASLGE